MNNQGKSVALVLGAGRGIGRSVALALAARGVLVAAQDISPVNLDETVRLARAAGGQMRDYIFDVAKKMPLQALVNQALDDLGQIDILVNTSQVRPSTPVLDMDEWDWHRTLDANLGAAFFAIQVVGREMRAAGGGRMVNLVTLPGAAEQVPGSAVYAAAQAGILSLTRSAALELAPFNIRLNAVCLPEPGIAALPAGFLPAPPGYAGELSDTVGLAVFLCSEAAAGISGLVFGVAID